MKTASGSQTYNTKGRGGCSLDGGGGVVIEE